MGVELGSLVTASAPVRTCIGCRHRAGKTDLLRVVGVGGRVVPDPAAHLPGRGAYVHRSVDCLDLAERRRAFQRALRLGGNLDISDVRATVVKQTRR